jgi:ATP/ADP translocase/HEAT repeat protein
MRAYLLRILSAIFPVQRHEWPKALMLLSAAALLGIGMSVSRTAAEGLFLTRYGVEFLPYLQLTNPFLVLVATTIYGTVSSRLSHSRLMIYTALVPIPLILAMRFFMLFGFSWVYFALFAFVMAYASVISTSWAVYLPGHYDVQEAKRLLPFIGSGLLIGTVVGGIGVAIFVPIIGAVNMLFVWIVALAGVTGMVQAIAKLFTPLDAETRKAKPSGPRGAQKKPGLLDNLKEGAAYSRSSALFLTTAIATIATMMALVLIDFEASKIFARQFPDSAQLTAFLGVVDGFTTTIALMVQWFIVPRCIRRLGVQGTNLLFPYTLTAAFGFLLAAPMIVPAIFARFTRSSLMPSLRGTTRMLIFNAVPRKTGALVRSFNTGIVLPIGQIAGALVLVAMKGLSIPILFPVLGLLISAFYIFYSYRQNTAYGEALLDLLKEDKIHLLDLGDDELRQLDATAIAAISERLSTDQAELSQTAAELGGEQGQALQELALSQEEETLAAIELLRTIGNQQAFDALQQHLPYASPRLTTAALNALTAIGSRGTADILFPYVNDPAPQVRIAAIDGLRQLGDGRIHQQMEASLNDPDMQVRAMALSVVLGDARGVASESAMRLWETMLDADDKDTQLAALSVFASVPETPLQGRLYRALDQDDRDIRREALRALHQLAEVGRITELDTALLRALEDEDVELRELTLQVLTAIRTDAALEHLFVLLDDDQPSVQETLINALKPFGKRVLIPLMECLQSPQRSLRAKETALLALARLDGVKTDHLLSFWETELRDVYRYKLMLTLLEDQPPLDADMFLRMALNDAYQRRLSLLVQLLAVWSSPEVGRLVENGLHDTDHQKRAQALEALESLSERRFTRLFLPILEADGDREDRWREVAQQQWELSFSDIMEVISACRQSGDKWLVIGALLSEQARVKTNEVWRTHLQTVADTAEDEDIRHTAQHLCHANRSEPGLALTDIILFLNRHPLFGSLSLDQLHTIAAQFVEREMVAEEVVFSEGDLSQDLYLIVSGKVDIVQRRGDTYHTIVTLSAGEYFGDMAIFEKRARSADAVVVESARLLTLSPDRFRQVVLQDPAISFEIFRELSARLRRLDEEASAPAAS